MLIAFAGTDGSGKSAQVKALAARLGETGRQVSVLDKWAVLDPKLHPECRFISTTLEDLRPRLSEMEGPGRALFLFWCLALSTTKSLNGNGANIFIADGYWMKHAVAEEVMGCPKAVIDGCVAAFPPADLVFYFDIDPALALARKGLDDVSGYECGCNGAPSAEAFIRHQTKLREGLSAWAKRDGWITIDAARPPEAIASEIAAEVFRRIAAPR